ncbi:MAG: hypothetical protein AB1589_32620 [Cyanobacteriota bacterium]
MPIAKIGKYLGYCLFNSCDAAAPLLGYIHTIKVNRQANIREHTEELYYVTKIKNTAENQANNPKDTQTLYYIPHGEKVNNCNIRDRILPRPVSPQPLRENQIL